MGWIAGGEHFTAWLVETVKPNGYTPAVSVEDQIRKALKADPRTSTAIGKAAGMNPVEIRRFRTTDRSLSVASLERLAKALGLKIVVKK